MKKYACTITLVVLLVWNVVLTLKVYDNYSYARKRANHSTTQILSLHERLDDIPVIVQEPQPILIVDNNTTNQ
jgi:hypothetical protein